MKDGALLRQFAQTRSHEAFRELVGRHTNLVYACALQRLRDAHAAEDVTQAVFLTLALKAKDLRADTSLPGWLFTTTRYVAARYQRGEQRRKEREMRAFAEHQITLTGETAAWSDLQPHLAGALDSLSGADREAVLLRFYQQASHREVAAALHVNEEAAKKRVNRALDKLRHFFTKKGVTLSVTAFSGLLAANAVQAAPAGLAATATSTALAGVAGTLATTGTLTLAKGALQMMFIAKLKTAALITAACIVVAGTGVVVARQAADAHPTNPPATAVQPAVNRTRGRIAILEKDKLTLHVFRGHSGIMRPVGLDENTVVILADGQPGTLADLKVDQWIQVTMDQNWQKAVKIEPSTAPWATAPAVLCGNPVCGQTINSANCIHDCPQCRRVKTNCAHKYCPDCARQLAVCMICGKALGPEATALINPGPSGDYASGKWSYHFVVVEKGPQTGYRQGFLKYDGREIFNPQPNDFIATPWGWMQWQDRELKAGNWFRVEEPRGWKPPGTPREARMKYRQLPDPATNPEILSNPPPSP